MIDDLEKRYSIVGKSLRDVEKLLGKADLVDKPYENTYYYYIGDDLIDAILYYIYTENGIITGAAVIHT